MKDFPSGVLIVRRIFEWNYRESVRPEEEKEEE